MSPASLRVSLVLLVSAVWVPAIHAQRDNDAMLPGSFYEVSGQIRSSNNRPVENVTVRLETYSGALVDQGQADSMGRFRFSRLRPGQYKVSAKASGLVAVGQTVDLFRASPRVHVLLQLVPENEIFSSRQTGRAGVVDVRVPVRAQLAIERARAALAETRREEALVQLQNAINLYPEFYDAHLLLAGLYMSGNEWDKAAGTLRTAMKINPKAVAPMVSLGEVYRRQKKYQEAQKVLEEALNIDSNSWEANFTLGRVFWELKDIAQAGKYIAKTIELQPNLAEAHLLAGNIFLRAGLPNNALVEYQEYVRLAPNGEFVEVTTELIGKLKRSLSKK